ncbi:hypothetical protein SprV_0200872300 [Sparganum proliferum]
MVTLPPSPLPIPPPSPSTLPLAHSTSPTPSPFPSTPSSTSLLSSLSTLYNTLSPTVEKSYGEGDMHSLRYKVDIAALNEIRFAEQGQLEEVSAGYTFFWSGRPRAERRDTGVRFALRKDIAERLASLPQGTNDRLTKLRLTLHGGEFATTVSVYVPP